MNDWVEKKKGEQEALSVEFMELVRRETYDPAHSLIRPFDGKNPTTEKCEDGHVWVTEQTDLCPVCQWLLQSYIYNRAVDERDFYRKRLQENGLLGRFE